jgi:Gas vesicle synthesis protein GvpL/GvpF
VEAEMSALYLYALLGAAPRPPARGLRVLAVEGLRVAAREVDAEAPPRPTETALRGHDATVRRLARGVDAVLPFRFGTVVAGRDELRRLLVPRAAALRDALALVAGREQMTLRVFGAPQPERRRTGARRAGGPGARYLTARVREHAVPEIDPIRPALASFIRAERTERHRTPPLLASVYHLVDRRRGAAYRAALRRAVRGAGGLRLRVTGPWPPYAFAPEPRE